MADVAIARMNLMALDRLAAAQMWIGMLVVTLLRRFGARKGALRF